MSAAMETAREAVVKAAVALVYEGMSEPGWQRIRRAVEAMEAAGFQYQSKSSQ